MYPVFSRYIRYLHNMLVGTGRLVLPIDSLPNWDPPPLPSQARVSPPLGPKGGCNTHLRVRGGGVPSSDDWTKSLTLCILGVFVQKYFGEVTVICTTVIFKFL
jgi:hypothetical protein